MMLLVQYHGSSNLMSFLCTMLFGSLHIFLDIQTINTTMISYPPHMENNTMNLQKQHLMTGVLKSQDVQTVCKPNVYRYYTIYNLGRKPMHLLTPSIFTTPISLIKTDLR